jgi:hypothetical protein
MLRSTSLSVTFLPEDKIFKSKIPSQNISSYLTFKIMFQKCGCGWTKHMATNWEAVEKKKSTDKEVEHESSEEEDMDVEPIKFKITANGNAQITVQNYNEPPPPKTTKRSQSHRHPNRLQKPEEPKREEKAKSEEKCAQVCGF